MARPFRAMDLARHFNGQTLLYLLLFLLLANLVLLPLALVVLTSLNLGPIVTTQQGGTLQYFVEQWESSNTGPILVNTIIFAIGSTVVAVSIGVFFAFLSER